MSKKKKEGFGAFDLFALGFGAIIGVGWSITLHRFSINGGGPIPASLAFLASMVLFIPIALVFAELASAVPVAGGVVAYAQRSFGRKAAFVAGWFLTMSYLEILPLETISITEVLAGIVPFLRSGPILYRIAGSDIYLYSAIVGVLLACIIILINRRGTNAIARFQSSLTLLLIITASASILICATKAKAMNLLPLYTPMEGKAHTSFLTGIIAVCALTPQFYAGFDTIPQSIEEAGGVEKKKVGRIVVLTLIVAGLFYALIITASASAIPWQQLIVLPIPVLSNLMSELYPGFLGKAMYWITMLGALSGLFTTWNSFYVAGGRLLMSLGRYKLIPASFAKVNERNVPYVANVLCSVIMLLGPLLGIGVIDILGIIGSFGFTIGWMISCLAFLKLRKSEPDLPRPYFVKNGNFIAGFGAFTCAVMMVNCIAPFMPGYMGNFGLLAVVFWTVLGVVFFFVTDRKHRTEESNIPQ
ncbi:MAG: APC family permease [Erysipelotrichaceae bacterium]|nr:APC family permease [Erysipelotrichaceae bacterium]